MHMCTIYNLTFITLNIHFFPWASVIDFMVYISTRHQQIFVQWRHTCFTP